MAKLKPSQEENVKIALRRAKMRGASPKETKALIEAMGVEANYENLNYGDRDSQGVLQQRPSQGWGPPGSVKRDVDQFLDRAVGKGGKYGTSGALAQGVQRSAFPDRYNAKGSEAQSLINQFASSLGSGGEAPKKGSTRTTTTTTPGTPGTPADPQARNSAILDYFGHRGKPGAILDLKSQLDAAGGIPGTPGKTVRAAGVVDPTPASARGGGGTSAVGFASQHVGGYSESSGSNRGPQLDALQKQFGMTGQAWCAMFATTAAAHGGASKAVRSASVAQINQWANEGSHGYQRGLVSPAKARPGDLMTFGDHHVGVVKSVDRASGTVHTIEGNTGSGKVAENVRKFSEGRIARPAYSGKKR